MRVAVVRYRARQGGFSYIGLLIAVALIGVALAATAEVVSTEIQRDREQDLLFVGIAYANAIDSYRRSSPGAQRFPMSLEELVKDPRFPTVRRHIRRLYRDPITGSSDWGIVRGPGNSIAGVYSKSEHEPIKKANFPKHYDHLAGAKHYSDWHFVGRSLAEDSGSEGAAADDGRNAPPPKAPSSPFTTFQSVR